MAFDAVVLAGGETLGKGIGLHPLITIVALLLGIRFFGLGGLLLALPVAAAVAGVLPIVLPENAPPPEVPLEP